MYKMAYYHMKVVSLDANFKSLRIDDYLEDSIQWGFLLQNKNVKGHCIKINLWEINLKSSTRDSENPLSDNITEIGTLRSQKTIIVLRKRLCMSLKLHTKACNHNIVRQASESSLDLS